MKTVFKIGMFIVLFLSLIYLQKGNGKQNDLILCNIEALANNEGGGGVDCLLLGSVDCPGTHIKVYKVR